MEIEINNIKEDIIIGCFENERHNKQPIVVDLNVHLYPFNWIDDDKLDKTVNYETLQDYVRQIIKRTEFQLLETLAQHISKKVLEEFKLIKSISLKLTKPLVCDIRKSDISVKINLHRKFKVAIALGSNYIHTPIRQLVNATTILGEHISEIAVGNFYETKPFGYKDQPNFYNTAIIGYTTLKPEELLGKAKEIEKLMGKQELLVNGPRVIDIDLIFFDDLIYTHNFLTIPHKDAHLRDFVLKPLADITPDWIHPTIGKSVQDILNELPKDNLFILKQVSYSKE
mgnify:CR=1 FL=1